jgi:hypothetical protein
MDNVKKNAFTDYNASSSEPFRLKKNPSLVRIRIYESCERELALDRIMLQDRRKRKRIR